MTFKDPLGNNISEGDYIIYPRNHNGRAYTTIGRVVEILEGQIVMSVVSFNPYSGTRDEPKIRRTTKLKQVFKYHADDIPADLRVQL